MELMTKSTLNILIEGYNSIYGSNYKIVSFELGFIAKVDDDEKFINVFSSIQKYDLKNFIKKLENFKIFNSMLINPLIENEKTKLPICFLLKKYYINLKKININD